MSDFEYVRGYISKPVEIILGDRQVKPPADPYLAIILDTINGADDKCMSYLILFART